MLRFVRGYWLILCLRVTENDSMFKRSEIVKTVVNPNYFKFKPINVAIVSFRSQLRLVTAQFSDSSLPNAYEQFKSELIVYCVLVATGGRVGLTSRLYML